MLRAFGHPVATCCDMLGVVGSNLKMVKFFMQHLWMLHDGCTRLARFVQQFCARACALVRFSIPTMSYSDCMTVVTSTIYIIFSLLSFVHKNHFT